MTPARLLKNRRNNALFFLAAILLISSSLSEGANAQSQNPIFPVTTTIGVPAEPGSIIADFNGDGKPDLAYPSTSTISPQVFSLNIILSIGASGSTTVTTQLCSNPSQQGAPFVVGDLNKDGKLDVVSNCNGYITVFFGNGDGTFQSPVNYAANYNGVPLIVDLNGDGYPDLALPITSQSSSQVAVFLNQGSSAPGTFGTPNTFPAGNGISGSMVAGDFNGDHKQDLFAVTSSGFLLLFGNGDGTFQAPQYQPVTVPNVSTVTAGDFNNDGITDIAWATDPADSTNSPSVQIWLGSSTGTLVQGTTLQIPPPRVSLPCRCYPLWQLPI